MRINDIDIKHNSELLREYGYASITNFLEVDFADKLYQCLLNDVNWGISCNVDGEAQVILNKNDINELDLSLQEKIKQLHNKDQFQFIYNTYMMVTAYIEKRDPGLYLHRFLEWLNSHSTIDYFRRLTGNNKFIKLSAQATRYLPGHYLTKHSDIHSGEGRQYAYIIGLTKEWSADWGGLLHIMDDKGNIVRTFIPQFNTLNIFKVPRDHFVSYVSPLAKQPRLSITGWLLSN